MLQAKTLRCEYRENPLGVFTTQPRLSWALDSDRRNTAQTGYELEVALDEEFRRPVWRTGEVLSAQSVQIPYGGEPLRPCTAYHWRVRIRDNHGRASAWSETAAFETAMLPPEQWRAVFITAEGPGAGCSSAGTVLRREFSASIGIKSARAYATAKGVYELYINGARVGDHVLAPGWTEYHHRLLYQTYDITALLRAGENAVGVMVGPGWYKGDLASWLGKRCIYGERTAALVQLRIEYNDGRVDWVCSDGSWSAFEAPVTYSELYHGECYDARLEQPGWDLPGFDDSAWRAAEVESADTAAVCPQDGLPVRVQQVLPPTAVLTTPSGDTVIDFGQNISGWVRFRVRGRAGDRVVLRHAETLDAAGNFYTENLRTARQTVEYTLRGGETEEYRPHFTFQGFRYISVDEWPGEVNADNFEAVAIWSDMRPAGDFECSHELLTGLVRNVRWSMRDNFVDIPTDCPQRDERLGWTGDAQVFVRAASFLMETAPFFRKWLRDVSASQYPDGGIPHVVPDVLQDIGKTDPNIKQDYASTGWGDVVTVAPWTMYKYFGDLDILREQYPAMKRWVDYIEGVARGGTLWDSGFHFGDWVALDAAEGSYFGATPNDLTATAYYAHSAQLLAKAAGVLGMEEDAARYKALHGRIVQAFQREFFTPQGAISARTQTAHILSLMFGLVPAPYLQRTVDTLAELLAERDGHLVTGFLGTPYFCQVLADNGRLDLAYDLLLKEDYPSWLYQVTKGATTVWEHWDGLKPDGSMWSADMNSFNHYAYGAVVDWIFSTVAGIDADESNPGFARIHLAPRPGGGLRWAAGTYRCAFGDIALRWEIDGGEMEIAVTVPHNSRAALTLPGMAEDCALDGVTFTGGKDGACAELGSGQYTFRYPYKA